MSLDTYEHVCNALDEWLAQRPNLRTCVSGKTLTGYFCRLESRGEKTVVTRSLSSTNDAIANALQSAIDADAAE